MKKKIEEKKLTTYCDTKTLDDDRKLAQKMLLLLSIYEFDN